MILDFRPIDPKGQRSVFVGQRNCHQLGLSRVVYDLPSCMSFIQKSFGPGIRMDTL